QADVGWEQVTLAEIRKDAQTLDEPFLALYCHTKGAHRPTAANARWRQAMTTALAADWKRCTELLTEDGRDSVGCHRAMSSEGVPFYAGNFWWARSEVLRGLPDPMSHAPRAHPLLGEQAWTSNRFMAEMWLSPVERWADVLPGTPAY